MRHTIAPIRARWVLIAALLLLALLVQACAAPAAAPTGDQAAAPAAGTG